VSSTGCMNRPNVDATLEHQGQVMSIPASPRAATPLEVSTELSKYFYRRVLTLYDVIADRPVAIGSGFVVSSQGFYFLVTAGHVLTDHGWRMPAVSAQKKFIRLTGQRFLTEGDSGDIGIVSLEPNHPLLAEYECTEVPNADEVQFSPGFPVAVGFPASRNKVNAYKLIVEKLLVVLDCEHVEPRKYASFGYSQNDTFLVSFKPSQMWDANGNRVMPPQLNGISGGPIFWLHERVVPIRRPPTLLGVISRKSVKQHLLIGTSIRFLRGPLDAASRKMRELVRGGGEA
jgi:hypothetical protein